MVDLGSGTRRTRRAVLTAAAAAGAATVVSAITKPLPVSAAGNDGAIIHVGDFYADVRSQTTLGNDTSNENVLWVSSNDDGNGNASGWGTPITGASAHGTGILGIGGSNGVHGTSTNNTGVFGDSTYGYGVYGSSNTNVGVLGTSTSGNGVYGTTSAPGASGVFGSSSGHRTGVQGFQGANAPAPRTDTGVMGTADGTGTGGYFEAPSGIGGNFVSDSGTAGLFTSNTGPAGRFTSATGNAIRVEGKASFTRAGRANIGANRSYVDVTVPGGLASTAFVVATLGLPRAGAWVASARVNYPTAGKVRIQLNKVASTSAATPVGWFVVG